MITKKAKIVLAIVAILLGIFALSQWEISFSQFREEAIQETELIDEQINEENG